MSAHRLLAILAVLAALAAALGAAGCGSSAGGSSGARHAVLPRDFAGIVSEDTLGRPGRYRQAVFARMAASGLGLIRQTFHWRDIERTPGRYDLALYDRYVADAARAGLDVLPILSDPPAFRARALPAGVRRASAPPRDPAAMARLAVLLERRYGPGGSLWAEHPQLPVRPIRFWQVWNEPNLPVYWGGRPDAAQYTRLLRVVGAALHRADRRAQVVTAGLPQSRLGIPFETYLRAMYAAGAQGAFDVLAINAYSRRVTGMQAAILGARRITASAEDGEVPIWVTEFGWATPPGPRSRMTVGPRTQSRLLTTAFRTLAEERRRLRLLGLVYYGWRDARPYPGGEDFWGLHTGLLDLRGRPKPALAGLVRGIRRARALAAAGG